MLMLLTIEGLRWDTGYPYISGHITCTFQGATFEDISIVSHRKIGTFRRQSFESTPGHCGEQELCFGGIQRLKVLIVRVRKVERIGDSCLSRVMDGEGNKLMSTRRPIYQRTAAYGHFGRTD